MVLAVPAPPARSAGSRLTAAIYGSDVTDDVTFLTNPPIFQADQSAVQSIPNNAVTALALDVEIVDSYDGHSNVTNNSRYTAVVAGWYLVIGYFGLAASAAGVRLIRINKNGSTLPLSQVDMTSPTAAVTAALQAAAFVQLAVGDYVETNVFQTSGGALNTTTTDSGMAVLFIHA